MSKLPLKLKKLNDKAVVPTIATEGSAGLDLVAISEKVVMEGAINYVSYGTGIAVKIPEGFVGLLFPRSSVTSNTSQILGNCVGVIDSDYVGEISFRYKNLLPGGNKKYNIGDKVGQLVIVPSPSIDIELCEELPVTQRGSNGYGSSGK